MTYKDKNGAHNFCNIILKTWVFHLQGDLWIHVMCIGVYFSVHMSANYPNGTDSTPQK